MITGPACLPSLFAFNTIGFACLGGALLGAVLHTTAALLYHLLGAGLAGPLRVSDDRVLPDLGHAVSSN